MILYISITRELNTQSKTKVEHLKYLLSNNSLSKNRTNEQSSVYIAYKHNYNKTYKHEIHTKIKHIFVIFASNTYNIHIHKISYKEKNFSSIWKLVKYFSVFAKDFFSILRWNKCILYLTLLFHPYQQRINMCCYINQV